MNDAALSKNVQNSMREALGKTLAVGILQLVERADQPLDSLVAELRFPPVFTVEDSGHVVFDAFEEVPIKNDGAPVWFRALQKDTRMLIMEGSAGVKPDFGPQPKLILPAEKFFVGQRISLAGFRYLVRFREGAA